MKKSIIPVAAFIAGMAIVPSVFAVDNNPVVSITKWNGTNTDGLAQCLSYSEGDVCKLTGDLETNGSGYANINKNMTLDLDGHTLTIKAGLDANAFNVLDNGTLTIVNGTVKSENSSKQIVNIAKGGSLVVEDDATLDGWNPVVAVEPKQIIVNGDIKSGASNAVVVSGATAGSASTVAINGNITAEGKDVRAYKQESGKVNATIKGAIANELGDAITIKAGNLTLTGAHVTSDDVAAFEFDGKNIGDVTINGCSEILGGVAALYLNSGAQVASLTIANSTLKSTEGNVITGGGSAQAKIEKVKISGSYLEAGDEDLTVKAGNIEFGKAEYDGTTVKEKENVLSTAKGSYGTADVKCDAAIVEPGDDNKDDGTENPNTADTIATYLTIAAVALLGLGATAFVAKKSNR